MSPERFNVLTRFVSLFFRELRFVFGSVCLCWFVCDWVRVWCRCCRLPHDQFKALSLPGEPAAESHCFYVSADMVRPAGPDDEFAVDDAGESPVPRSFQQQQQQQSSAASAFEARMSTVSSDAHVRFSSSVLLFAL